MGSMKAKLHLTQILNFNWQKNKHTFYNEILKQIVTTDIDNFGDVDKADNVLQNLRNFGYLGGT